MSLFEKVLQLRVKFHEKTGLEANILILGIRQSMEIISFGETKEEAKLREKALSGLDIIYSKPKEDLKLAYCTDEKDLLN